MASGFDFSPTAFGAGLLGTVNQNMANQRQSQQQADDAAAKAAADNANKAKQQDDQDKREAKQVNDQAESLAKWSMDGYGDVLPGHIAAAHDFLTATGADISKYRPEELGPVLERIRNVGNGVNNNLASKTSSSQTQAADTSTAAAQPVTPAPTTSLAVPASTLQPGTPAPDQAPGTPAANATQAAPTQAVPGIDFNKLQALDKKYQDQGVTGHGDHVMGILKGDLPPPNSNRSVKAYGLTDELTSIDPTFSVSRYNFKQDFNSTKPGTMGGQLLQVGQAINHLDLLDHAADAMRNGDYPALNKIVNTYRTATGDASVTDYQSLVNAVAPEVNKVYRPNGGTGEEVDRFIQTFTQNGSPAQIHGAIADQVKLLQGRLDNMDAAAKQNMGNMYDKDMITSKFDPNVKAAWERFQKYREDANLPRDTKETGDAAAKQQQNMPTLKDPSEVAKLPPNTPFKTPDGRIKYSPPASQGQQAAPQGQPGQPAPQQQQQIPPGRQGA